MYLSTVVSPSSGKLYEVRRGRDGVVYCTCPAWRYANPHDCKHLLTWRRTQLQAAA